jgi:ABC-2 type transport system permease protein
VTAAARAAGRRRRGAGAYLQFSLAGFQALLQYRGALLTGLLSTAVATTVQLFLWRAIYAGHAVAPLGGMTRDQMTTYVVIANLLAVLLANQVDDDVAAEIYRGDIAINLVRPVSYPLLRFCACLPVVATNTVLTGIPVALLFVSAAPLTAPGPADAALFAVAAVLSLLIGFAINFLTGLIGFVTTNTWGIRYIKVGVVGFLSGQLLPLALMPSALSDAARVLPFQSMVSAPVRLFLGQFANWPQAAGILAQQAGWAAALTVACRLAWRRAEGRVEVLGG